MRAKRSVTTLISILFLISTALPLFASSQPYITGHAINFGTDNKYHAVVDLSLGGSTPLIFKRTYTITVKALKQAFSVTVGHHL